MRRLYITFSNTLEKEVRRERERSIIRWNIFIAVFKEGFNNSKIKSLGKYSHYQGVITNVTQWFTKFR